MKKIKPKIITGNYLSVLLVLMVVVVGALSIVENAYALGYAPVGACGTANGQSFVTQPAVNCTSASFPLFAFGRLAGPCQPLCGNTRSVPIVTLTGSTWNWTCIGVPCSATKITPVNGACGSSDDRSFVTKPTTGLCSAGNPTLVLGTGPWTWTCEGTSGGSTASCGANKLTPINGACGTSNNQTLTSAPTTGLCLSGMVSPVTGTGPWNWSCIGSNGGITTPCQALILSPPPIYTCNARICSPIYKYARENNFTSYSSTCSTVIGSKTYTNDCSCASGASDPFGYTATCFPPINGTCGTAKGVSSITQPAANLCGDGSLPAVTKNATTWDWTCAGKNTGASATCSAPIKVNGACGSSGPFATQPTTNLCLDGSTPGITGTGAVANPWRWTCNGIGGGEPASCSATMMLPTLNFSVVPNVIQKGGASTLSWTTANATSCWATGGWTGWKSNTSNSQTITPPVNANPYPQSITYNLECWNAANESTGIKQATINIQCTPDWKEYSCEKTTPDACSPETCDQTQTGQALCYRRDANACNGSKVEKPTNECVSNGVSCTPDSVVCPQCIKTGNWKEVGL